MKRRRHDQLDSLELLLDTICNMFGGVIFIAILLALLAGKAGDSRSRDTTVAIDELRTQVERLEASAASVAAVGTESVAVDSDLDSLARDASIAQRRLERAEEQLRLLDAADQTLAQRLAAVDDRRQSLETSLSDLESKVKQQERRRIAAARLPAAKATDKIPIHLAIRDDRAFEIYRNDGRDGYLEQPIDVSLDRQGPEGQVHVITLRNGGGFRIDDAMAAHPRWRALLARISPDRHFLYLMVYPSGFENFRVFRDALLEAGFEYDIVLIPEGQTIILSPGSDFSTQ